LIAERPVLRRKAAAQEMAGQGFSGFLPKRCHLTEWDGACGAALTLGGGARAGVSRPHGDEVIARNRQALQ